MQTRTKTILGAGVVALAVLLAYRFTSSSDDAKTKAAGSSGSAPSDSGGTRVVPPAADAEAVTVERANDATVMAATDAGSRVWISAGWGSGARQLGRERPQEGNPEGPMSLALSGTDLLVVDQVNGRLVRYDKDGRMRGATNMSTTVQDVAVGKDGTVAMIDRLVDKNITVVDGNGKKVGTLPLSGKFAEPGLVTAVVVDGKNVYAEQEHGALVLVGYTDGTPASGAEQLAGRPSRDGTLLLTAGIQSGPAGRAYLNAMDRATGTSRFAVQVSFPRPSHAIVLLDSDARGTLYLGLAAGEPPAATIACLSPQDGHVLGRVTVPLSGTPEESFRDFTVGDDGSIVFAVRGDDGVEYRTTSCP